MSNIYNHKVSKTVRINKDHSYLAYKFKEIKLLCLLLIQQKLWSQKSWKVKMMILRVAHKKSEELYQPLNFLPLLRFHPGGLKRSWPY